MKCFYYWLTFLVLIFHSPIYSQEVGLNHYARKLKLDSIHLPGDEMKSAHFNIPFPDSLYDFGYIEIKRAKLNNTRAFQLKHSITHHKISSTIIQAKGKNNVPLLISILQNKIPDFAQFEESKSKTVMINGYRTKLYFTSSKNRLYLKIEKME